MSAIEIRGTSPQVYRIKALHVSEKLRLKDLREKFSHPPIEFSNYEMVIRYGDDSFAFVYNYGSVVFFNVPEETQERELREIQPFCSGASDSPRTNDVYLLEVVGPQAPSAEVAPPNRVFFDRIVVQTLTYAKIHIACVLLAESTALEYYEILIENLLERTNTFSKKLERQGRMLESSEDLIKFIGMCLNTKQEIISNLYIVDSPDETWESPELDKVHQELKVMLDIDTRYRALDYKIRIIQESVEVIVDLSKSRRETTLEMIIIALIGLEIVLSVLKWH